MIWMMPVFRYQDKLIWELDFRQFQGLFKNIPWIKSVFVLETTLFHLFAVFCIHHQSKTRRRKNSTSAKMKRREAKKIHISAGRQTQTVRFPLSLCTFSNKVKPGHYFTRNFFYPCLSGARVVGSRYFGCLCKMLLYSHNGEGKKWVLRFWGLPV